MIKWVEKFPAQNCIIGTGRPTTSPTGQQNWPKGSFFVVEKTKEKEIWKNKLLNYQLKHIGQSVILVWWCLLMLFPSDPFCWKHDFPECKTYFRQSPRVLAVRELFNSHCPFDLIHGTFLTVCATDSDISQNNEVFHVIMTIQEKNYNR